MTLQAIDCHVPPWDETSLGFMGGGRLEAVARHKGNVYLDLSGWAPKYFPPQLVQYARPRLQDRVLFGSDWPVLTKDVCHHPWSAPYPSAGQPARRHQNCATS